MTCNVDLTIAVPLWNGLGEVVEATSIFARSRWYPLAFFAAPRNPARRRCGVGDQTGASVDPGAFAASGFTLAVNQNAVSAPNNLQWRLLEDSWRFWDRCIHDCVDDAWPRGGGRSSTSVPYASPADAGPASTLNASFSFVSSPIILPVQATDIAIAIAIQPPSCRGLTS